MVFRFFKSVYLILSSVVRPLITEDVKCTALSNNSCLTRPILTNLNPEKLRCYPFIVSLDRCYRYCNTFIDLSNKIVFQIK